MAKRALNDKAAPHPEEGSERPEPRYFEDEHGHRQIFGALSTQVAPAEPAAAGTLEAELETESWPPYKTIWFTIAASTALWAMIAAVVYALA
jgi:hypothetical protein